VPPRPADPATSAAGIAAVIVLAAGQGTRMKSNRPKVLHELAGKPLIWHALASAAALEPTTLVAVLGHGRDEVGSFLADARKLRERGIPDLNHQILISGENPD